MHAIIQRVVKTTLKTECKTRIIMSGESGARQLHTNATSSQHQNMKNIDKSVLRFIATRD